MAPKIQSDKKNDKTHSPPGLRPRKHSLPSTSTPVPVQQSSRKRKPSMPGNLGKVSKKRNEPGEEMIRSPAERKKTGKGGFSLDPPTLLLAGQNLSNSASNTKEATMSETRKDSTSFEAPDNSGNLNNSSELLLDSNVFLDENALGDGEQGVPPSAATAAAPNVAVDPFAKLHALMESNFASIKSDTQTMSGQLGMLQSNVNNLNTTVSNMKTDFDSLNGRLTSVTAQAVANKCGISNINKQLKEMQARQDGKIEERVSEAVASEIQRTGASARIPEEVNQKLDRMTKELDKVRALQAVQQMSSNHSRTGSQSGARRPSAAEDESRQYWEARKKIRCSPVDPGKDNQDLYKNACAFLDEALAIPEGELAECAVVHVKKVPGHKRNNNQREVVITFDTVQTRDCVASYAPNLAHWRGQHSSKAGLRLEIPDYLCGVFRVLERHAHQLKQKNLRYFKRSIKYDDVNLSLVLDYCCKEGGAWQRVHYEEAAELTRGRAASTRSSTSSYQEEDKLRGEETSAPTMDQSMPGTSSEAH